MAIAVSQQGLDCRKCSAKQKINHGYAEDSPIPKRWQIKEWVFKRCPVRLITKQSIAYLEEYSLYKRNILPHGGGSLDESEKYLSAMKIIDAELRSVQNA